MSLFRPEALAAQQTSALGRILLFTPRISTFLVAFICLVTVLLILFVIFGSYTKKATVYGELVPVQGVIKVYPPQSGRVESIAVQHGAKVRKGEVLLRINSALDTVGGDTQARVLQALRVQQETLSDNLARNGTAQHEYAVQMAARHACRAGGDAGGAGEAACQPPRAGGKERGALSAPDEAGLCNARGV